MSHIRPSIAFIPAIFITLNIMLGAGLFLNTTELAIRAGSLGYVAYILVGILMLPLVLGISKLVFLYPKGGFYIYGASEISPFAGFVCAWSYFVGKLASATLMMHTATLLLHAIIPPLRVVPIFVCDSTLIILFCMLNTLNVRIGTLIQYFFFGTKLIPVMAMISSVLYWINPECSVDMTGMWEGIPSTLPLVLYAVVGFEAACSLSSSIENAHVNAPRVILYSYSLIVLLTSLYQWAAYAAFGSELTHMYHFFEVFSALAALWSGHAASWLQLLFYFAIAASVLGAAYGILYSNLWNLYILAEHRYVWGASLFTRLNKQSIPIACVGVEGLLCFAYIFCSGGAQVPLQQIASLSIVITYSISAVALWYAVKRQALSLSPLVPICAFINCCMLAAVCIVSLLKGGNVALWLFVALCIFGIGMALIKKR